MTGLFAAWQPLYAEAGIATFPVREKRPAVKGYLKIGGPTSAQLAMKFANENAFGFACKRNRITILDVDTPDERVLADALAEHGSTPVIVRSGSGNWQAWYRHDGENRRVRPDPEKPIDLLGDGFVVAPPSHGSKGPYEFIQGGLADIANLPKRTGRPYTETVYNRLTPSSSSPLLSAPNTRAAFSDTKNGERNNALWREAMRLVRQCETIEQLMDKVMQVNAEYYEPLPAEEVLRVIASAWGYQADGQNWIGTQGRATVTREEVLAFPGCHALRLWLLLKASHTLRQEPFVISQIEVAELLGVHQPKMPGLIRELIDMGLLRCFHFGTGKGNPHKYVLTETHNEPSH